MNKNELRGQLRQTFQAVQHLRIILFLLLLILLYGFISWRIYTLADAQPDAETIASQTRATSQPHIDPALVDKIKQLEDNSITVQALFDEARQNPFRE